MFAESVGSKRLASFLTTYLPRADQLLSTQFECDKDGEKQELHGEQTLG